MRSMALDVMARRKQLEGFVKIDYGKGTTKYGLGVRIELTGDEVANAIATWLVAHNVFISGARTVTVNNEMCEYGQVYVDPSGFVITPEGQRLSGRGPVDAT
jgi:hypothetical protein